MYMLFAVAVVAVLALLVVWLIGEFSQAPNPDQFRRRSQIVLKTISSPLVQEPLQASVRPAATSSNRAGVRSHFVCSAVKVHDGDGPIWCSEGERIRLAGIAARELDESCRSNQPCPTASGASAQKLLENMVLHKRLICERVGSSYNRTVAWCHLPHGEDVSCEMMKTGTALRWDRYDTERRLAGCSANLDNDHHEAQTPQARGRSLVQA
jgi:endonuclease YncB( thermonuclease family)